MPESHSPYHRLVSFLRRWNDLPLMVLLFVGLNVVLWYSPFKRPPEAYVISTLVGLAAYITVELYLMDGYDV